MRDGTTLRVAAAAATLLIGGCSDKKASDTRDNSDSIATQTHMRQDSGVKTAVADDSVGQSTAITLDTAAAREAGIVAEPIQVAVKRPIVSLVGLLRAEPDRITTIQAPVSGRLRIDSASADQWPAFGSWVSAGMVLGQVSDARPITAPASGTVTRVFARPGEMVQAGTPLLELTDFSELLASLVWTGDALAPPPRTVMITPVDTGTSGAIQIPGVLVGPAAEADSLTRDPVYLYRIATPWRGARPGASVMATFADERASTRGIIVPTDAVIQWEGLAWTYVERSPGVYIRERLDAQARVADGWVVRRGSHLQAGDRVVVRGAELLLSEEFRSRVTVGEDEDKR